MATAEQTTRETQVATTKPRENLPAISAPRLPYHPAIEERFGIDKASWKALVEAIFPNAVSTDSVILALSYCRARKLDPFKRNVHIVPIYNSQMKCMIDSVWPGTGELPTTAFPTGLYAGLGEMQFGPDLTQKVGQVTVTFPEWAQVTVYRMVGTNRVEFCGPRVYWLETYAVKSRNDDSPNQMWADRPRGQITKCAEAAALRAAFPEEISDYIPEEVEHNRDTVVDSTAKPSKPSLDSLADKFAEGEYKPPMSAAEESQGEHAEEVNQGDHIEDVDQSEAADPLAELAEAHPLFGLPTMLKAACEAGSLEKINTAEASYTPMGTEPSGSCVSCCTSAKKLCEAARDFVRSKRGGRSNK